MPGFLASFLIASLLISPLAVFAQEISAENPEAISEPSEAPHQSIPVYLFASEMGDILGILPITPNLAVGCTSNITTPTEAESSYQPTTENHQGIPSTPTDPICSIYHITQITDISGYSSAKITDYLYDDLYRLTTASTTFATTSTDYLRTYSYDALGNITNKSDQGNYGYGGNQGASYANPHAVTDIASTTSYSYDKNGNLTSDSTWTYGWNYNNTLASSTNGVITVDYGYDYAKQRVLYDNGTNSLAYPNKYYNVSIATTTRHIFAGNQLVAAIEGTGTATTTNYIHTDHLGGTHIIMYPYTRQPYLVDLV